MLFSFPDQLIKSNFAHAHICVLFFVGRRIAPFNSVGNYHRGTCDPSSAHWLVKSTQRLHLYSRKFLQVIKGWTEAMQMMKEGDHWELYIPSGDLYTSMYASDGLGFSTRPILCCCFRHTQRLSRRGRIWYDVISHIHTTRQQRGVPKYRPRAAERPAFFGSLFVYHVAVTIAYIPPTRR